jgi:hypothetical protein
MRNRRLSVVGAVAVVVALAVVSVGCTNPQPPSGVNIGFDALSITNIKQNEHSGPNFWDNDDYDEPYLAHLGIRIKLTGATKIDVWAQSTYDNNGQYICKFQQGQTCPGIPGDGATYDNTFQPDFVDLSKGEPLELLGTVDFSFERDQLIPFGLANALTSIAQLVEAALPTILAHGGALPTDPQGLINFIEKVLPPALGSVISIVAANLGAAIGGDGDDLIGFEPFFFFSVGGQLRSLLQGILPTLLQLVNQYLMTEPNSPLPTGIPAIIGVVGQGVSFDYGHADVQPRTVYRVNYGWVTF